MNPKALIIPAASIDLGHFAVKICAGRRPDGQLNCLSFPSVAAPVSGDYQVHTATRLDGVEIHVDGVPYFVGADAKNVSAGQNTRAISEDYSRTPEYRALLLGALYHLARMALATAQKIDVGVLDIKTLVLGLPLNTLSTCRDHVQTLAAGPHHLPPVSPTGKGPIEIRVGRVVVVGQPTGALMNHSRDVFKDAPPARTMMVLDCGGGTVDWFVTHDGRPILARSGAYPRGTLAQAFSICERLAPAWRDDPLILEQIDAALQSDADNVLIGTTLVDLKAQRPTVSTILADALRRLADKAKPLAGIGYVLVTGGGAAQMHKAIQQFLPDLADAAHLDPDPVFSNARGFFMIGEAVNHGLA